MSPGGRAELVADLCDILEEDSWLSQPEQYHHRVYDLSRILDDHTLRDQAMDALEKMGSQVGYYLEAREKVYDAENAIRDHDSLLAAIRYLDSLNDQAFDDLRILRLYLKVWWLLFGSRKLFVGERVRVGLSPQQWGRFSSLLHRRLSFTEEEGNLHARFLYAWSLFQSDRYRESREEFRVLDQQSLSGKYRVVKLAVWANSQGDAIPCSGTVRTITDDYQRGFVYCPPLRMEIPFQPNEFPKANLRRDDPLDDFFIAFNFRGPTADPARFSSRSSSSGT